MPNNTQPTVEQVADAMAPPAEARFTLKNVSNDPLRFVLLEDGYLENNETFRNVPAVEQDTTKWIVDERTGQRTHPAVLYGPKHAPPEKKWTKQLRERAVLVEPGKSVSIPMRFLPALVNVRCDVCAYAGDARGRCRFPLDDEHRATWRIMGGALLSPTTVQIDVLANVPIDGAYRMGLEEDAKANRSNGYGRKLREPKA